MAADPPQLHLAPQGFGGAAFDDLYADELILGVPISCEIEFDRYGHGYIGYAYERLK